MFHCFDLFLVFCCPGNKAPDTHGTPPALVGGLPVGGGVTPQAAFMYRGVWIPIVFTVPAGQARPT